MTDPARTVAGQLADAERRLAAAGIDTPRVDAEWLLADVLGVRRVVLWTEPERGLDDAAVQRYGRLLHRRARREPLQQITGWQEFRGLRLRVTPDVLVPRPETELLVEWALELWDEVGSRVGAPQVVDVGTGSGCIACALAVERPGARVLAIERSTRAAAVAHFNAAGCGVGARVSVVVGDLLDAVAPGRVPLIVSNPPYLASSALAGLPPEVGRHDPRGALDGGADGLTVIRRLVASAATRLVPDGTLLLETSGDDQAGRVAGLLRAAGLSDVATRRDLAGVGRFVAGRRR